LSPEIEILVEVLVFRGTGTTLKSRYWRAT